MSKKTLIVSLLSLAMLAGCTVVKPSESSKPLDETSSIIEDESSKTTEESSKKEDSSEAPNPGTSSTEPAPSSGSFQVTTDLNAIKEIHTAAQKTYLSYSGSYATIPTNQYPDGKTHQSDPQAVKLEWNHTPAAGKSVSSYYVTFGQKSDLSDGYSLKGSTAKSLDLYNVFLGTNYFKIGCNYSDKSKEESSIMTFKVDETAPRNLKIDGMTNCRDMGGRTTLGGGKIKQGLIYRTSGVKGNNPAQITSAGVETMENHLKVKTEVNVSDSSTYNGTGYSWTVKECLMNYNQSGDTWHHFSRNAESVKAFFKILEDQNNYPVFYHCRIGTDRTGLCAILINGLLGVDKNEIMQDYLFSNFGKIGEKRYIGSQAGQDNIENYLNEIEAMPGATWANKTYNTLLAIGLSKTTLDNVMNFLTEGGTGVPGNDNGQLIGTGSALTSSATKKTSSDRNNPAEYYEIASGGHVTYSFNLTSEYNAYITGYMGLSDASKSKYLSSAMKVEIDGTEVTLPNKSYYNAGFGNISGRTCYYFNKIGEQTLSSGAHTVKITSKTSGLKIGAIGVFKN